MEIRFFWLIHTLKLNSLDNDKHASDYAIANLTYVLVIHYSSFGGAGLFVGFPPSLVGG